MKARARGDNLSKLAKDADTPRGETVTGARQPNGTTKRLPLNQGSIPARDAYTSPNTRLGTIMRDGIYRDRDGITVTVTSTDSGYLIRYPDNRIITVSR